MSLITKLPLRKKKQVVPRQILSSDWQDRRCILEPDVNLVCWQRSVNEAMRSAVDTIMEAPLPALRLNVCTNSLAAQLAEAASQWNVSEETQCFWQDVQQLTADFLDYSSNGQGVLHIRMVDHDACRKFHIDGYRIRLFTTYYGPGTEWLPENSVDRRALGKSNDLIVKDTTMIRRLDTFHVGILKGEMLNESTAVTVVPGIVHRSPPITRDQLKRLILRIDIN